LAAIAGRCWHRTKPTSDGWLEATPDSTLAELQAALARRLGIVAGLSTIHNALRRIGLRHKKSP
jgi:transposase